MPLKLTAKTSVQRAVFAAYWDVCLTFHIRVGVNFNWIRSSKIVFGYFMLDLTEELLYPDYPD